MDDDHSSLMAPSKADINAVIMDYLIAEGYPAAAEKFAQETNLFQQDSFDITAIKDRVKIRDAIYSGRIEEAIQLVNEIDAELHLIEMIRTVLSKDENNPNVREFQPAIEFATEQLAPHAATDAKHLDQLEKTMALMIFKPDKMIPEMKELLDPRLREKVAAEVNKALLVAKGRAAEARIKELVRTRAWAEAQARDAQIPLPDKLSIGLDGEVVSGEDVMVS